MLNNKQSTVLSMNIRNLYVLGLEHINVNTNGRTEMGFEDMTCFGDLSISSISRPLDGYDENSVSIVNENWLIRSLFGQLFHHNTIVLLL